MQQNVVITREPQYSKCFDRPRSTLGTMASSTWAEDPKRLGFTLARYKFVAQMFAGRSQVAEIGCADGWAARVVAQSVGELHLFDFDMTMIPPGASVHDIVASPLPMLFDGVYLLDVLEHIPPADEDRALDHIRLSLTAAGAAVIGCPSLESQPYASEQSRIGHVNCMTQDEFRATLSKHFRNVFVFGMNDEILHTGYGPMCHYRLAVCTP